MTSQDVSRNAADSYAKHMIYQLAKLKVCRIQHPHFNDSHAYDLALALEKNPQLQKLELTKCTSVSSSGMSILANSLTRTNISRLELDSVPVGDKGLQAIVRLLQSDQCKLRSLGLDGSCNEKAEDPGKKKLASEATTNDFFSNVGKLRSLDMSRNSLTDKHIVELAKTLAKSDTLDSIILSENPIGDEGVKLLCEALDHNKSLILLALGDCGITEEGLRLLNDCIRRNCNLQRVYLYSNKFDCESPERIEMGYWLELNARGRGVMREDGFRSELIPRMLAKASQSPKLMYGLLMELPHVWAPKR